MSLPSHEEHHDLGATFMELNDAEAVRHYGDFAAEYQSLKTAAAVLDFSFRSRLVLIGADRIQFLHSQCTNDIKRLGAGQGCYTAITNNKGRMQGDANVFVLADEILLDSEPGQTGAMTKRFEQFIVSDDVEIVDAAPHYGLLTVQGPKSADVILSLGLETELPTEQFGSVKCAVPVIGELYVASNPRLSSAGFDLFIPVASMGVLIDKLVTATRRVGGGLAGWEAFDIARIDAGIPRFGEDMTEANLAPEAGIESRAISYNKGCYIGQEVLNRLRTFAEVSRKLCRLKVSADPATPPEPGTKLLKDGKEAGTLTSVTGIPGGSVVALGYVRKQWLGSPQVFQLPDVGTAESTGGPD